jgi:hypothetical protein
MNSFEKALECQDKCQGEIPPGLEGITVSDKEALDIFRI